MNKMKPAFERISPDADSSFHRLLTPHLNDVFLWHYHPEYEIVYIDGVSGTRHVGDHISRYEGSNPVFIGPNIPGWRSSSFPTLPLFDQKMALLTIFQRLATSEELEPLHGKPVTGAYNLNEQQRLRRTCQFTEVNCQRRIEIAEVADLRNLTESAFCWYFKRMTHLTFTQFLNQYRVN